MKRIIILGGYGDGIVVASALRDLRDSNEDVIPFGFLNDFEPRGKTIDGLPVLGKIADATQFLNQKDMFFVSDLLKVKLELNKIEVNKLKLDNGTEMLKMVFSQYIGIPYNKTMSLNDSIVSLLPPESYFVETKIRIST